MAFWRALLAILLRWDSLVSLLSRGVFVAAVALWFLDSPTTVRVADYQGEFALGRILTGTLVSAGLLFAAGAAWVSSRGPDLRMASDLIKDDEYRFFRLKIENRGDGTMIPKVSIRRVVDVSGIDLVAQVPFELGWSHHERAVRPEIPSKMSETVGVAFLRDHSDAGRIRFYGMAFEPAYDPFLVDKERERIYRAPIFIQIEASILKLDQSKTQSRWFCLVPDDEKPMFYHSSNRLPPRCQLRGAVEPLNAISSTLAR